MFRLNPFSARGPAAKLLFAAVCAVAGQFIFAPGSFGNAGDLYVTDLSNGSVIRYDSDGNPNTFATGLESPQGITFDVRKNIYVADAHDGSDGAGEIVVYALDGTKLTSLRTDLDNPMGIDIDGSDLLVSENGTNSRVLRVPLDGIHPPTIFQIVTAPKGLASQAAGQLGFFRYIAHDNFVREVPEDTSDTTEIDVAAGARGVAIDQSDNIFVSTDLGTVVKINFGTTTPVPFASGFTQPTGMDFRPARFGGDMDRVGFLYVADTGAGSISQVGPDGVSSLFVPAAGTPNYVAFETNAPTPTPSPTATPSPTPTSTPEAGKPLNISTRVDVQTGDNVGIGGFIITGGDGITTKTVAIRAIGPSLAPDVQGVLPDPILELHNSDGSLRMINNDWKSNSDAVQQIIVDAGLAPTDNLESVIVATLAPVDPAVKGSGEYTAVVRGNHSTRGIGLVEIYDLDGSGAVTELGNISTRGFVGTGDNVLIGGVIVGPMSGSDATAVVRAIGPSLGPLGVAGALADPFLQLFNENGDQIAKNDNWKEGDDVDTITKFGLAPDNESEAALLANLIPGLYTAIVSGVNSTTGVALVEIFHVPAAPAAQ